MFLYSSKKFLPCFKILLKPISTTSSSDDPISTLLSLDPPHRALSFFKHATSNKSLTGPQLTQLHAAIIHITTHAQMYPTANSLTRQLIIALQTSPIKLTAYDALRSFSGPKFTPKVFDVLIVSLYQLNLINEATHVLYRMKELPAVQAFNCVLNGVLRLGRFDVVWGLFDEMCKRGVRPNVFTYNILINACRYEGDVENGVSLMEEMVAKRIDPTVHTYTILICGMCANGDVKGAVELFERMTGAGVLPNLYTYNALIDGHFKNADVGGALAFYGRMIENEWLPNDVSFATLIDGLCTQGRMGDARRMFVVDMAKYGVFPTVHIYNCMIDGHCKLGNLDDAFALHTKMRKVGLLADGVTYGILIKGLCDAKRVGEAADLLSRMQQDGILANSVIYNTVIDGYCKEGDLQKAIETCSRMSDEGIEPNLITLSSLIDGYCKKGEMETARGVYTEMAMKGFEPDVVTCTALIDGYARTGSLDKMFSLEKEMLEKGISPNVVTNTCLINGLCREGLTHGAINLYVEKASSSEFKPNGKTYMALVYSLYRAGQYFKAGRFYMAMRKSGIVPDVVTYLLLMRGQCQMGYVLNAMLLQADMIKIGAMPEDWYISCPDEWSVIVDQSVKRKFPQAFGVMKRVRR